MMVTRRPKYKWVGEELGGEVKTTTATRQPKWNFAPVVFLRSVGEWEGKENGGEGQGESWSSLNSRGGKSGRWGSHDGQARSQGRRGSVCGSAGAGGSGAEEGKGQGCMGKGADAEACFGMC